MWLFLLVGFLIVLIVYGPDKLEKLLKKREALKIELEEKKELKRKLERQKKWWLYPGYTILLLSFLSLSSLSSQIIYGRIMLDTVLTGAAIVEVVILIVFLFSINKVHEFKYVLEQFEPFLRRRIYGLHINIDNRINKIEKKLRKVNKKLRKFDAVFG